MRPKGFKLKFQKFQRFVFKEKGLISYETFKTGKPGCSGERKFALHKTNLLPGCEDFFCGSETKVSPCERFVDVGKPNAACIPTETTGMPWKMQVGTIFRGGTGRGGSQRNSHGTIGSTNGTQRLDTCGAGAVRRVPKWFCMKQKPSIHHRIGKPCNGGRPGLLYQSLSRRSCHLYLDRWMDNISKTHHITWSWSFMLCALFT